MYELTKHEELILLAVLKLKENAYIITIRRHIKDITGKSINYGSLCNTLSTLIRKKYIKSRESDPEPRQGGRRKVLYSLTAEGRRALKKAYEIQKLAWDGLEKSVMECD
ncbi:MAG: helix-turn-helix transcriptional regulator [Candidatus Aminicenantes bacterium]